MGDTAYDNPWWPVVYDHWNERGGRLKAHEREFEFYSGQLAGETGPVLEVACGTGSILIRLLQQGLDIKGFDSAEPMLALLREKAGSLGIADIDDRISCQNMVDFHCEQKFAAIIIPANSFMLLATQEEQIACLQNIHAHLAPAGRLLLNLFIPSFTDDLLPHSEPPVEIEELGDFPHPATGGEICVTHSKTVDLGRQCENYRWYFTYEGEIAETTMRGRWIYTEEFKLLLRLAGFSKWQLFGSHDGQPYKGGKEMTLAYWICER